MADDPPNISRRDFLKRTAVTGGAVVAAGAVGLGIRELTKKESSSSTAGPSDSPRHTTARTPSSARTDASPSQSPLVVDTRWPIKHVVYVMLENRSLNHMFGAFPGTTDTTRVGLIDGKEVPLIAAPEWLPADLPHDRTAALNDVNDGKMDGFAKYDPGDVPAVKYSMSLHERDLIPNWWHWAENFVLCDHVFASANSASYPNHLYMIAGTSGGAFDNPEQSSDVLKVREDKGLAKTWGCDVPNGAYVDLYDYSSGDKIKGVRPCFTFDTQGQQLSRKDVDWAFYAANERESGYIWNAYASVDGVFSSNLWDEHIRDVDHLVADIRANRLPSVTWVTPRYEFSDHPPYSTIWAQNWATQVISAIMTSPMWSSTAVFVTWDEWGGTYDPVAPPTVDALGLLAPDPLPLVQSGPIPAKAPGDTIGWPPAISY
jgi:phospholipase C